MSRRKALITQAALLSVAVLMLWLAMRNVPLREVWSTLRGVHLPTLLLLAVLNIGIWLLVAMRWWLILLGFDQRLPFLKVLRYRLTAYALSYVTPGPQLGGEVLMVYYPSAGHGVPTPVSLAATSVDKSLEFLGNFSLMAVGLLVAITGYDFLSEADLVGLLFLLALLLVPVGLLLAIWRGRHPFSTLIDGVARLLTPARRVILRRAPGLRSLPSLVRMQRTVHHIEELIFWLAHHRPWSFLSAMGVTLLSVAAMAVDFWVINQALGIDLRFWPSVSILVLVFFAFLLPVPAGLGAMEAALVTGYTAMGHTGVQALSVALLMRSRDLLIAFLGFALGGLALLRPGAPPAPIAPDIRATPDAPPASPRSDRPVAAEATSRPNISP